MYMYYCLVFTGLFCLQVPSRTADITADVDEEEAKEGIIDRLL